MMRGVVRGPAARGEPFVRLCSIGTATNASYDWDRNAPHTPRAFTTQSVGISRVMTRCSSLRLVLGVTRASADRTAMVTRNRTRSPNGENSGTGVPCM
jgi:hypothetical protein